MKNSAPHSPERTDLVLRTMHRIRASQDGFAKCTKSLLELGCKQFELPFGFVARQVGDALELVITEAREGGLEREAVHAVAHEILRSTRHPEASIAHAQGHALECHNGKSRLHSYLGISLEVNEMPWGVLGFGASRSRPEAFTSEDEQVLELIAQHLASALNQEQLKSELRSTQERYRYFVEETAEGFYRLDVDQPIPSTASAGDQVGMAYEFMFVAECNNFYAEMYGYSSAEEMIGMRLVDLHKGPLEPMNRSALLEFVRLGYRIVDVETQEMTASGGTVHLLNNAVGIVEDGRWLGIWGTQRDITERKASAARRETIERKTQQAQKLESLGLLAGGIAHDFNNLLTGVLGNAQLIRADLGRDSPSHTQLKLIEQSARRASELCQQLLDYSGKGQRARSPIDMGELVSELASMLRVSIPRNVELALSVGCCDMTLMGDPSQLRQIVLNLITNAADAIGEARGVIEVNAGCSFFGREELRASHPSTPLEEGHYAYLVVSDTGSGISEETERRMFEPFFSTKQQGRGLGLAAVLGIVRTHLGAIEIESEPGHGTSIRLLFPANEAKQEAPEEHPELRLGSSPGSGLILVVDDDDGVRSVAASSLERAGYAVHMAADGKQGLELFLTHHDEYAAVLLDVRMPELSGDELLHAMRRIRPDLPILLISGFDEQDLVPSLTHQARTEFLRKPFGPRELLEKLSRLLQLAN